MSNKITKNELHTDIVQTLNDSSSKQSLVNHEMDFVTHIANGGTTTGTATAYICDSVKRPTTLVDKVGVVITVHLDSGVNPTLKWGAFTAYPLLKANGESANLKKDGIYTLRFSTGKSAFILQGESEVEIGKQIITPGTTNKAILKGLHDGTGYVEGSPNLVASNVKQGVNLFGVVGTFTDIIIAAGDSPVQSVGTWASASQSEGIKLVAEYEWLELDGSVRIRHYILPSSSGNTSAFSYITVGAQRGTTRNADTKLYFDEDFVVRKGDRIKFYLWSNGSSSVQLGDISFRLGVNPKTVVKTIMG